jgi:gliding motility associated protien GldN
MKRAVIIFAGLALAAAATFRSQAQVTEVYAREHIANKAPIPYSYLREADVFWAKDIYRIIDLKQKQNLALYYPTHPIGDRINFIDLILKGVDTEGIRAFSSDDPLNEFTIPLTKEQIDGAFDAGVDTIRVPDVNTNEIVESIIPRPRKTDEVKQLLVKEKWFFDRNHSVMNVRIIGICPLRIYNRLDDQGMPTDIVYREKTFWVYFDEIRPLLSNHEIFNRNNDAQRISFDDFFMQRRFNSYIWAESNVYDNRTITSYAIGIDALLEADKIKNWLFDVEHDLWEY